jgi:tyrosine-protein phosphatase YwqE
MFTYINENFLHAPSADLSRDTVKTLISLMLAQGQEVFLEKQITDGKKVGLLAKLASQAAHLYGQAMEGVQESVTKAIFERVWLLYTQVGRLLSCWAKINQPGQKRPHVLGRPILPGPR